MGYTPVVKKLTLILVLLVLVVSSFPIGVKAQQAKPTFSLRLLPHIRPLATNQKSYTPDQLVPMGEKAMLQTYYKTGSFNGNWWDMLANKSQDLVNAGFDSLWIPPFYKGVSTYQPYDYYDLGEFNQMGGVETQFGSRAELEHLIATANSMGLGIVGDIVINHRDGGAMEFNPYTGGQTPTDFTGIASGKLKMNYTDFWPNAYGTGDRGRFGALPDISHKVPYVAKSFIDWGKWLRDDIGFDGWRFDLVWGIDSNFTKTFIDQVGGYFVGEYWNSDPYSSMANFLDILSQANSSQPITLFDFFLMYELQKMADRDGSYDMRKIDDSGFIWNNRIDQSTTFVVNHDTSQDKNINIVNRFLPYAYILTHQGYPSVYWEDYFNPSLQPYIQALLQVRNQYANGDTKVLYTSPSIYAMERTGDPGLIFVVNDSPSNPEQVTLNTEMSDTKLYDALGSGLTLNISTNGETSLNVPPYTALVFTEGAPLINHHPLLKRDKFVAPEVLVPSNITIDGKLGFEYGNPVYIDNFGDAGTRQTDLQNAYMHYDEKNLYIGFSYGKSLEKEVTEYGIALDVKSGGDISVGGPSTSVRIKGSHLPDYSISLFSDPTKPFNDITSAKLYQWDGSAWSSGQEFTTFAADPILGFAELSIPLSKLGLSGDQPVRFKVFSSLASTTNAVDSMPNDEILQTTDGNSWLDMGTPLTGSFPELESSSSTASFYFIIPVIIPLLVIQRLRYKQTQKQY